MPTRAVSVVAELVIVCDSCKCSLSLPVCFYLICTLVLVVFAVLRLINKDDDDDDDDDDNDDDDDADGDDDNYNHNYYSSLINALNERVNALRN